MHKLKVIFASFFKKTVHKSEHFLYTIQTEGKSFSLHGTYNRFTSVLMHYIFLSMLPYYF